MLWMLPSQLTDGIACMGGGGRGREGGGKGGVLRAGRGRERNTETASTGSGRARPFGSGCQTDPTAVSFPYFRSWDFLTHNPDFTHSRKT